jgi:nucleoside-diphosphate-sugar epimerase
MKRVLITGGTGFIGRHCLQPLRERGFEVHVVGMGVRPKADDLPDLAGATLHRANLMDETEVREVMERIGPTHLLHLAWETAHGEFWTSPRNLDWVSASLRMFRMFQEGGGQRVVTAGSCAEYAWTDEDLSETTSLLAPGTLYGKAKKACGELLAEFSAGAGMSSAWGRVFFLYGPHEGRKKLIAAAIYSLLRREPFECSHGMQVRDFLHVADVGRAFAALLDSPVEGPVNIASGSDVTLRTVLSTIGDILDARDLLRFGAQPPAAFDPPRIVASVRRLTDEVGFSPTFDLRSGLEDAVSWWAGRPQG